MGGAFPAASNTTDMRVPMGLNCLMGGALALQDYPAVRVGIGACVSFGADVVVGVEITVGVDVGSAVWGVSWWEEGSAASRPASAVPRFT